MFSQIGPDPQANNYYRLTESKDHLTLQPVSKEEMNKYSPLETLQSIKANLEKLKTNEKTLQYVDSILNGYISDLKKLEESHKKTWSNTFETWGLKKSRTEEDIHSNWNKAIALCHQIKTEWKEIGGRVPDIFLGKAFVSSADGKKTEQVEISCRRGDFGGLNFFACINDRCVGSMKIDWMRRLPNGEYGSDNYKYGADPHFTDGYYHENPYKVDKEKRLNIIMLESLNTLFEDYKGVGSVLIQAAMEYGYSKGCEGRLSTNAVRNASPFYYKLGMRSLRNQLNTVLKKVSKKQRLAYDFGSNYMFMTPLTISEMKERIRENPIFPNTYQYLGLAARGGDEVLELFSKEDRKLDHDVVDNFLKWQKKAVGITDASPKKVFDFLRLFPMDSRIVVVKRLMTVTKECDANDLTHWLHDKTQDVENHPINECLAFFCGVEGVEAVSARSQIEQGPLSHLDDHLLKLFSPKDKDQNYETILALDKWIEREEGFDEDKTIQLLQLFRQEDRIAAAKKIVCLTVKDLDKDRSRYQREVQVYLPIQDEIANQNLDERLKFFEGYQPLGNK